MKIKGFHATQKPFFNRCKPLHSEGDATLGCAKNIVFLVNSINMIIFLKDHK
jgi:hypothetical protein